MSANKEGVALVAAASIGYVGTKPGTTEFEKAGVCVCCCVCVVERRKRTRPTADGEGGEEAERRRR